MRGTPSWNSSWNVPVGSPLRCDRTAALAPRKEFPWSAEARFTFAHPFNVLNWVTSLNMTTASQDGSKNVLNSDVELKGTLTFAGELTFDGKLEGDIKSDGTLNLGDNAVVKGTIEAGSLVVRGKITGNLIAKDKIEIKSKTELFGDVRAAKLVIEEGVTFVGKSEVNPNKVSPTPAPATGAQPVVPSRIVEPAKPALARSINP